MSYFFISLGYISATRAHTMRTCCFWGQGFSVEPTCYPDIHFIDYDVLDLRRPVFAS